MKRVIPTAALIFFLAVLYFLYQRSSDPTGASLPGISGASQVASIVVPARENSEISYDVTGYRMAGGFVMFLPTRAELDRVVFYALDDQGQRLMRFEHDFSEGPAVIAQTLTVNAMNSSLPSVEMSFAEGTGSLEEIEASDDHRVFGRVDLTVTCRDETAASLGCESRVVTRERGWSKKGSADIRGHGNASWLLDKKSYNIELDAALPLLGMGQVRDYVLLANAIDYSLIRNQVFFEVADECGLEHTPPLRQVDLFIDGQYRGCYSLCPKVEVGAGSINITPGRDFLYRWGMPGDTSRPLGPFIFRDEPTNVVEVRDIDDEALIDRAFSIAEGLAQAIERTDSDEYLDYIDPDSWARYYWLQEYAKNTDATSRSVYTIWDSDEEIMRMGPVWDLDQTAGVVEPFAREVDYLYPTGWAVREEEWYVPLFEHPEFEDKVRQVYFEGGIREALMKGPEVAERCADEIRESAEMNFIRWDVLGVEQNNHILKWMGESTIDTQQEWLMEWLRQRAEWIDEEGVTERSKHE